MSRNDVLLFGLISLISMLSSSVTAGIDCQKQLRPDENQQVCERYARMMPELQHVQRVSSYSPSPIKLNKKNTLYIFDAATFNGDQAVYNFLGKVTLPENSVLAGNQLNNQKARLVFDNVSGGESGLVIGPGARYALSDIELVTYASNVSLSRTLEIRNARQVSLDRVSITGHFEPLPNTSASQELLTVSCLGGCPSTISIRDSRIHLPYLASNNLSRTALAATTSMDEGTGIKLLLNRSEIVLDNYSLEKIAILITGKVQLEPGSVCNSVIDEANGGIDLLPGAHKSLFVAVPSSKRAQAIGFTNGYGFGWYMQSNGRPLTDYDTQGFWHQKGLNLECPSSATSAGCASTYADKKTLATFTGITILLVGCLAIDRFINRNRWQEREGKQAF